MVSVYRACKRTGRTLLLDLYALEILAATGKASIPAGRTGTTLQFTWPEYQRRHIARTERFDLVDRYRLHRIYREALAERWRRERRDAVPDRHAGRDIDLMPSAWDGARMIWSQWSGLPSPMNQALAFKRDWWTAAFRWR